MSDEMDVGATFRKKLVASTTQRSRASVPSAPRVRKAFAPHHSLSGARHFIREGKIHDYAEIAT
jgi:hypothetical protein